MELKLCLSRIARPPCGLLIVPYGIETMNGRANTNDAIAFNRTLWN